MEYSVIVLITVSVRQLAVGHGVERGVASVYVGHAHSVLEHSGGGGGGTGRVGVGQVITRLVVRGILQVTPATLTCDNRAFPLSKDILLAGQSTSLASLPVHRTPLRYTLRWGLPKGDLT